VRLVSFPRQMSAPNVRYSPLANSPRYFEPLHPIYLSVPYKSSISQHKLHFSHMEHNHTPYYLIDRT